uniref:Uncharacterized protein n=1 Tax=Cyprinus carpio TaxID=7962 RepID=A0A8C2H1T6_CYPCA
VRSDPADVKPPPAEASSDEPFSLCLCAAGFSSRCSHPKGPREPPSEWT